MNRRDDPLWERIKKNIRRCIISGLVVIVPVALTIAILKWIFNWLAGFLSPVSKGIIVPFIGRIIKYDFTDYSPIVIPIIAILLLLIILYLMGVIARLLFVKKLISLGEAILFKIPIVRTIYHASKQVVEALSMPDKSAFKGVVVIEFPGPGMKALGFITGKVEDHSGKSIYKIFIPTSPNPTTGFLELIEEERVQLTDITVDEALKMLISAGILSPRRYTVRSIENCHLMT